MPEVWVKSAVTADSFRAALVAHTMSPGTSPDQAPQSRSRMFICAGYARDELVRGPPDCLDSLLGNKAIAVRQGHVRYVGSGAASNPGNEDCMSMRLKCP